MEGSGAVRGTSSLFIAYDGDGARAAVMLHGRVSYWPRVKLRRSRRSGGRVPTTPTAR